MTHVYFDFFGTLVNYDPDIHPADANAPHGASTRLGLELSPDQASAAWETAWSELDGRAQESGRECSMWEIARRFFELSGVPQAPHAAVDRLVDEYLTAWTANIQLASDVPTCLRELSEAGLQLSVVSNTHHPRLVQEQLARFGIAGSFRRVHTSVEIGWRKPWPELFDTVLERDGIVASQAAFVGDTWEADVAGPRAAGMRAYYVGVPAAGRVPVPMRELAARIRAANMELPGDGPARISSRRPHPSRPDPAS